MTTRLLNALLSFAFLVSAAKAKPQEYSQLWGKAGENWSTQSRLPDFSFAGYHAGEKEIPTPPVRTNVRAFGAKGDGVADDTAAFKAAIAATDRGAILVPAGRYRITGFIDLKKSNLVLRGEGANKSVLYFDRTLTDVEPKWGATTTGQRTSSYSWSGGFVRILGEETTAVQLAFVTAPFAQRGDEWLPVSTTDRMQVGQWIVIKMTEDKNKSLLRWLYNDETVSVNASKPQDIAQVARVREVDAGKQRIRLDRALRYELRAVWKPLVEAFAPTVTESGVEHLGIEFPPVPYAGHFTELGYNAFDVQNVAHCWIRDVRIHNSDSGISLKGTHCTIDQVVLTSQRAPTKGETGHHGIAITGADNLITRFDFRQRFIHDLTLEMATCAGNVFSEGRGVDLCFDHHKRGPHANLFTNIDCGAGKRVWASGGGDGRGKNSAGWETFWNLRSVSPIAYPSKGFGPWSINVIGIKARDAGETVPEGKWYEAIAPDALSPANLHTAQLAKRRAAALSR